MDEYINIEKYRSISARLRQLEAELDSARTTMSSIMGFVADAWQSNAGDAFLETSDWTAKDIERLRFEMEELAAELDIRGVLQNCNAEPPTI